MYKVKNETLSP